MGVWPKQIKMDPKDHLAVLLFLMKLHRGRSRDEKDVNSTILPILLVLESGADIVLK